MRGAGSTGSLSPGPARGSCRRRGRLCHRCCHSRSAALPSKKNKALAKKRWCKEVTMHRPPDRDPPPVARGFPWMSSHLGFSQQPHPSSGDAGGVAWPRLQHWRQLQIPPRTPQNISRLHTDEEFRCVTGVWIHRTGLTGNGAVRRGFCTSRLLLQQGAPA